MLNVIDEFTRDAFAIRVSRRLRSVDVIDVLSALFIQRGIPGHVRSDIGQEFIAKAVREWIAAVGAKTAYVVSLQWRPPCRVSFIDKNCPYGRQ